MEAKFLPDDAGVEVTHPDVGIKVTIYEYHGEIVIEVDSYGENAEEMTRVRIDDGEVYR